MSVHYNFNTGSPNVILSTVRRRVSAFTRANRVCNFKIGITNNPERRWREAHKPVYDEMLVVYQSSSINCVSELEYELVNHNWQFCDNKIAGGGGGVGSSGPFYLYVVLQRQKGY